MGDARVAVLATIAAAVVHTAAPLHATPNQTENAVMIAVLRGRDN